MLATVFGGTAQSVSCRCCCCNKAVSGVNAGRCNDVGPSVVRSRMACCGMGSAQAAPVASLNTAHTSGDIDFFTVETPALVQITTPSSHAPTGTIFVGTTTPVYLLLSSYRC